MAVTLGGRNQFARPDQTTAATAATAAATSERRRVAKRGHRRRGGGYCPLSTTKNSGRCSAGKRREKFHESVRKSTSRGKSMFSSRSKIGITGATLPSLQSKSITFIILPGADNSSGITFREESAGESNWICWGLPTVEREISERLIGTSNILRSCETSQVMTTEINTKSRGSFAFDPTRDARFAQRLFRIHRIATLSRQLYERFPLLPRQFPIDEVNSKSPPSSPKIPSPVPVSGMPLRRSYRVRHSKIH